jgi:hypothetical protein
MLRRLRPNYALRDGGQGYVGDPARADVAFARATLEVLVAEAAELAEALIDGRLHARHLRSPFHLMPFLRTDFWPVAGIVAAGLGSLWLSRSSGRRRRPAVSTQAGSPHPADERGAQSR